ncbi:MAG: hypothetical protein U1C54_10185 [Xanthomonadaceae bacterium]|nr:hypothetical protein [Xanthomonadaceae bacterium]MDZ4378891.1 hypothetical protein [Xanthomonadaceae bacterium]
MTTLHRAAALLSLLLPMTAIAADQVAPVVETLRPVQGATIVAAAPDMASSVSAPAPAAAKDAAYVPKTAYDNSPYRFNAGARFTAEEFDAWMKSRGIRVAKGKPAADADTATATAAAISTSASSNVECNTQAVSAC